jgi:hypothetical protein
VRDQPLAVARGGAAQRQQPDEGANTSKVKAVAACRPASAVAVMNQPESPSNAMPVSTVTAASSAPQRKARDWAAKKGRSTRRNSPA